MKVWQEGEYATETQTFTIELNESNMYIGYYKMRMIKLDHLLT